MDQDLHRPAPGMSVQASSAQPRSAGCSRSTWRACGYSCVVSPHLVLKSSTGNHRQRECDERLFRRPAAVVMPETPAADGRPGCASCPLVTAAHRCRQRPANVEKASTLVSRKSTCRTTRQIALLKRVSQVRILPARAVISQDIGMTLNPLLGVRGCSFRGAFGGSGGLVVAGGVEGELAQ
jgi:hypothetical protein